MISKTILNTISVRILVFSIGIFVFTLCIVISTGCDGDDDADPTSNVVPYAQRWGIYALDLATDEVYLIISFAAEIQFLRLNTAGDRFIFSQKFGGNNDEHQEICMLDINGTNFERLTNNAFMDVYPASSPGDTAIVFLSSRQQVLNLDLYIMSADGNNQRLFYDSGSHDADVHWVGDVITFTAFHKIWTYDVVQSSIISITDPPNAGVWGNAPYPIGDYDPRLSPDGTQIAFSRMVDASNPHGGYDIYVMNSGGSGETNLTNSGYTQGLASWSHSGDRIVYEVAAIGAEGKYDIYIMNADGSDNHDATPDYFPLEFLCHSPNFSPDDSQIFFIGEWYE